MRKWIAELFYDQNDDADETVLYAMIGIVMYNALALYSVVSSGTHDFDMQSYGIGFGAILAAVFGGYGIKAKLERKSKNETPE